MNDEWISTSPILLSQPAPLRAREFTPGRVLSRAEQRAARKRGRDDEAPPALSFSQKPLFNPPSSGNEDTQTQSTSTVVTTSVHTTRIEQQHTYSSTISAQAQPRSIHDTPQRPGSALKTGSGSIGHRAPASSTRRQRSPDVVQSGSSMKAPHLGSKGKAKARKLDDNEENGFPGQEESPQRRAQNNPKTMQAPSRSPRMHSSIDVAGLQSSPEERRTALETQPSPQGSGSPKHSRKQDSSHERIRRDASSAGRQEAPLSPNVPRAAAGQRVREQGKKVEKRKRGAEEAPAQVHHEGGEASMRKERKMRKGGAVSRAGILGVQAGRESESTREPTEEDEGVDDAEVPNPQARIRATKPRVRAVEPTSRQRFEQLDDIEVEPLSQPRDAITADVLSGPEGDALADTGQGLVHDRPHSRAATSPRNRPKQPRHKSVMSSIELVQESWRAISRFIAEQRAISTPRQQQALTILHDLMAARQFARIHKLESLKKSKAALNQVTADLQTLTDERLDLARQMKTEEASWRESRQRRETVLALHQKALDLQHERLDADPDDAALQEQSAPATLEVALHGLQTFLAKSKLSKFVS